MPFVLDKQYLFNSGGATSPGGAGTTTGAGQGWNDQVGGEFFRNSSGQLCTTDSNAYYRLTQTGDGYSVRDQRAYRSAMANTITNGQIIGFLRSDGNAHTGIA